jgi:2Fe-2S ferredoxin
VPKIVFEAARPERTKTAHADGPGALVDVADEVLAQVPFSCRSATCGTCICRITEGLDRLEPPGDDEAELLELMAAGDDTRLCCQARFKAGQGTIVVRALDTGPQQVSDDDD